MKHQTYALICLAAVAGIFSACSQPAPPAEPVRFPPIVSGGGMAPVDAASAVKVPEGGFALDIDPICEMKVKGEPVAATFEFEGKTYGFCSVYCKESFEKEPKKHLDRLAKKASE